MAFNATINHSDVQPDEVVIVDGDLIVNGSVAGAAPANALDLMRTVIYWTNGQPSLNGKIINVYVTDNAATVTAQETITPEPAAANITYDDGSTFTPEDAPTPINVEVLVANFTYSAAGGTQADTGSVVFNNDNCTLYALKPGITGPEGWDGVPVSWTGTRYLAGPKLSGDTALPASFASSVDGVTWDVFTEPATATYWQNNTYKILGNDNIFIMVHNDRGIYRTDDLGATWLKVRDFYTQDFGVDAIQSSLCYGNGYWVVGAVGGFVWFSLDGGSTWNTASLPPILIESNYVTNVWDVIFDGTQFVLLASKSINATGLFYSGATPETWEYKAFIPISYCTRINYVGTKYIIYATSGPYVSSKVRVEVDKSDFSTSANLPIAALNFTSVIFYYGNDGILYNDQPYAGQPNGGSNYFRRSTDADYTAYEYVPWSTITGGFTITQEDIDIINEPGECGSLTGKPIVFQLAAVPSPAVLTQDQSLVDRPIAITYPVTAPAEYVQGVFSPGRSAVFKGIFGFGDWGQYPYMVASQNGQFFNWSNFAWQAAFTGECKRVIPVNFGYEFTNLMCYVFSGRKAVWGGVVGPRVFYLSLYKQGGEKAWTQLVSISAEDPSFTQLISGGKYLNFNTGLLQLNSSGETWLKMPAWSAAFGNAGNYWMLRIADLPLIAPGLEPYQPPDDFTPQVDGGDYSTNTCGNSVPTNSSPFTLQSMGGFTAAAAAPWGIGFMAGMNQRTAPPMPMAVSGGTMLHTSSVPSTTYAAASTQHMGVPFEVRG